MNVGSNLDDDEDSDEDSDGDLFGNADVSLVQCAPPSGYVQSVGDCDDTDASISPQVMETWYDGIDQNCDGLSDYDQDGDGFACDWDPRPYKKLEVK